jgi:superfamily II DNA/RNA helicase
MMMNTKLKKTLEDCGYTAFLPVQEKAIPLIEEGRNAFIQASTGSGKTLAYLIPALEMTDPQSDETSVLILAPTRELAVQIAKTAEKISVRTGHHIVSCIGGIDINIQKNALKHRPQILIGTPGRLNDLLSKDLISFSSLKMVILDEADQIISTGQKQETIDLFENIPAVQTVCLSATKTEDSEFFLPEEHEEIILSNNTVNDRISSYYMICEDKQEEALHLLQHLPAEKVILFTNYKNDANDLYAFFHAHHIRCASFSSYFNEKKRLQTLADFKNGKIRLLIATDAAARGLDLTQVSHIIHYDLPFDYETYVHRSGRTAHQGNTGVNIVLCTEEESQSEIGKRILEDAEPFSIDEKHTSDLDKPLHSEKEKKTPVLKLFIRAGRKDKIRPGDIIGALCTVVDFKDIGVLEIQDHHSTVTILRDDKSILKTVHHLSIKGKKRTVELQRTDE